MDQTDHPLRWYALRTRSRHEKLVREQLANQGIEPLLPTVKRLSQWKDRKKEIEVPLFSGYCFVRFASEQKLPVLKTIGVVDIVGADHCPEPIPDEEIAAIKTLMTSVLPYDPHPYLHEGMHVDPWSAARSARDSLAQRKASPLGVGCSPHSASGSGGD
jgi:transcription antitermination factor NusG